MIYTHTSNPSIDYYLRLDHQHEQTIYRAQDATMVVGGKGINVSIVLNEFQVPSVVSTFLAGKMGEWIADALKMYPSIQLAPVIIEGSNRINVKIRGSSEFDINAPGPMIDSNALKAMKSQFDGIKPNDVVVVSGSLSPGVSKAFVIDLAKKVHDAKGYFVLDTSGWNYAEVVATKADLIKPNLAEFDALFADLPKNQSIASKAKRLMDDGIQRILLSKGSDGAEYFDVNGHYTIIHPSIEAVDTVGCGDSMIAGFLYGWTKGMPLESTLKVATACGIACAATIALPTKAMIDAHMANIQIKREGTV